MFYKSRAMLLFCQIKSFRKDHFDQIITKHHLLKTSRISCPVVFDLACPPDTPKTKKRCLCVMIWTNHFKTNCSSCLGKFYASKMLFWSYLQEISNTNLFRSSKLSRLEVTLIDMLIIMCIIIWWGILVCKNYFLVLSLTIKFCEGIAPFGICEFLATISHCISSFVYLAQEDIGIYFVFSA